MVPKIKQHRVQAGETQAQVAAALGVSQPTFQRWETGKVDVPAEALAALSKRYGVTPHELQGRYVPLDVTYFDSSAPSELQHYGECAIHFLGGGDPLVLTISEAAYAKAFNDVQHDNSFIIIQDLGNRTVAVRRTAISELYFSSEAYDTYGPEHENYKLATVIQMPDPRDWDIVEALNHEAGISLSVFDSENVERVRGLIGISDERFDMLVADGVLKPEELDAEKIRIGAVTEEIIALSHTAYVRLSSGVTREFPYIGCDLYDCLCELEEWDFTVPESPARMIVLPTEDYHHTAMFPAQGVDYISFPTHKVKAAQIAAGE